jgi:predicted CopG family antitoxin
MISIKYKKLKQIAISEENWKALSLLGHTNESFNDVMTRLLQQQQQKIELSQSSEVGRQ